MFPNDYMQISTFLCPHNLQERNFFRVFVSESIRNDIDYPGIKFVLHVVSDFRLSEF